MLTINKNSWHYKLWDLFQHDYRPKNLCQYVRQCVGSFAFGIVILIIALWIMYIGVYPITYFFEADNSYGVFMMGMILDGYLLGMTIRFYTDTGSIPKSLFNKPISDVLHQYLPEGEVKEKKPNIVWEYLKALHEKTCPMIEYTDDKDD